MNKCLFIGRIARNPEMKQSPAGKDYCAFMLAVDRPDNHGGGDQGTDFIDIIAFDGVAQAANSSLAKGRLVQVECLCRITRQDDGKGRQRMFTNFVLREFQCLRLDDAESSKDGDQARANTGRGRESRRDQQPSSNGGQHWDPEGTWGDLDRRPDDAPRPVAGGQGARSAPAPDNRPASGGGGAGQGGSQGQGTRRGWQRRHSA